MVTASTVIPSTSKVMSVGIDATKIALGMIVAKMGVEPLMAKIGVPYGNVLGNVVVGAGITSIDRNIGLGVASAGITNAVAKLM